MLAAVLVNLANAHLVGASDRSDSLARAAALRAIALVASLEETDAYAAEVSLKARHLLCHAAARSLSEQPATGGAPSEDVHDATDLADEGLALIRRWEQKGVTRFRDLALDLYRFGARVYARYQPQFLSEFLREHADWERLTRSG